MLFNLLCLSTSYADCIAETGQSCRQSASLPQHVLRGLHPLNRREYQAFRLFALARPTRIASCDKVSLCIFSTLCLSTSYADCISPADGAGDIQQPFASARPTRIASRGVLLFRASGVSLPQHVLRGLHPVCPRGTCATAPFASACPTRIASFDSWIAVIRPLLCLSTSYADCIGKNAQGKAGVYDGRCCESVDSFSIIEER